MKKYKECLQSQQNWSLEKIYPSCNMYFKHFPKEQIPKAETKLYWTPSVYRIKL